MNKLSSLISAPFVRAASFALRRLPMAPAGNLRSEIKTALDAAREKLFPDDFQIYIEPSSDYFKAWGFHVSKVWGEGFSRWSGIVSDRYCSPDLYYGYIIPALNRYDFFNSLTDKGFYSTLFSGIRMPKTIIKNRNGIFFDASDKLVGGGGDAFNLLRLLPKSEQYIIKPTVATACGRGIGLLDNSSCDALKSQLMQYGKDYIIQVKMSQHRVMSGLNESSLNTLRLYTYRDLGKKINFVDEGAIVRIGGKGEIRDNVSAGGGLCAIAPDGSVSDRFMREKDFTIRSLARETGMSNVTIPNYAEAKEFVCRLHERLPYFDFIGWDVALNEDANPVFIEFNVVPFCEGPQMAHGPMFGKHLDEVMERIKECKMSRRLAVDCTFTNGYRRMDWIVTY